MPTSFQYTEELSRTLFQATSDSIFISDAQGCFLEVNPQGCALLGYSQAELGHLSWFDLFSPEDQTQERLVWAEEYEDQSAWIESQMRGKEGQLLRVEIRLRRLTEGYRVAFVRDITERKRVEETLRRSEQKFETAFRISPDAINLNRLSDGLYIDINEGFTRITGYSREEALSRSSLELTIWADPADRARLVQGIREQGRVENLEAEFRMKDGSLRTGLMSAQLIEIEAEVCLLSITRDITERKQMEVALQESEARLGSIIDSALDAILALDEAQSIILFNAAAEKMFGYSAAEMVGQPLDRLMPERFREMHQEYLRSFYRGDEATPAMGRQRDIVGRRANGAEFPVEASISHIEVSGAKHYTAILRDITERKQAEAALRESEARYRLLAENVADVIWVLNTRSMSFTYVSPSIERLRGYSVAEVMVQSLEQLVTPDSLALINAELPGRLQAFLSGDPAVVTQTHELEQPCKDGSTVWTEVVITFLQNEVGEVEILGVSRDISARKQAEAALRESEERFRLFMDNSPTTAWMQDEQSRYVYLNRTYEKRFGVQLEEWRGKSIFEVWPAEVAAQYRQNDLQMLAAGRLLNFTQQIPNPDGSYSTWWIFKFPFQDAAGQRYLAGVGLDISERQQAEEAQAKLEEQLRQAQKMESIGRLAGGVAHDFNNLLTVILGYSELMQARLPREDRTREQVEQIRQAAQRAEALTRQLLAFSRKQMLVPVVLDLNELVTNLRKMLERLIGEDIILTTLLQPDLWSVKVDPGQIEQVIMNLAVNARDAMPTGGRFTIETANVQFADSFRSDEAQALSGPGVRLTVTDTGHGMDEATLARIFEPFFTTKEQGKGTGLGLATVYGIIKQSGGEIIVDSQPGQGSVFSLYLPALETISTGLTTPQPEPAVQPGRETILLVEDELGVRNLVRVALHDYGYTLLEADHGYQALALAQQEKSIDLLLTDVVMPQMDGRELAERIKALHPHIKVLFISGYTDDEILRRGVQMAEVEFMAKPFSPVALAAKVRAMLDK